MRLAAIALVACACHEGGASTTPSAHTGCSSAYPYGILSGSQPSFLVAYQLTSSYAFKDPDLAHESLPDAFTNALNRAGAATGITMAFQNANGVHENLTIIVNTFTDSTQDRYGMSVEVWGTESMHLADTPTYDPGNTVELFGFTLAPLYLSGDKLIDEAAANIAAHVAHGWTCN